MMPSLFQEVIDPAFLVLTAILLVGISGAPGLFLRGIPGLGQKIAVSLATIGCLFGFGGSVALIAEARAARYVIHCNLPFAPFELLVDPLSALFLLPIFLISACAALYGFGYWPAAQNRVTEPKLSFFFGLLTASMASVVVSANSILFLMAWEIMAISAYFVLTTMDHQHEVREAGTLYMITTHIGTLTLFAMFSLLRAAGGSFLFPAAGSLTAAGPLAAAIFFAALIGFGLKAGVMPLHIWLPSAHANAPSHVSALMSGVLIKMGIYGMVRVFSLFHSVPVWWGITVLAVAIVSGVLGVAFAIGQHDLKRLLAYHSIENIGIIAMGIGIALIGKSLGNPTLMLLGMAGALLHVLNHSLFKSLLFFAAGSAIHAVGTREIDLMGGLVRRAPYTAFCFLAGAVAICGLPPLNGFVSEFLIYIGFFSGIGTDSAAMPFMALAAPSLALIGGLAVACFIKVYGIAFLGAPRTKEAEMAHEGKWVMRAPMILIAAVCAFIGLFPMAVAGLLEQGVYAWQPGMAGNTLRLAAVAPLRWLTISNMALLGIAAAIAVMYRRRLKSSIVTGGVTWDCGYLRPAPRMQYTASSFGEMLVKTFNGVLRPHAKLPQITSPFPRAGHFASHVPEAVLELIYLPFLKRMDEKLSVIRKLQHGQMHFYILYTLVTLLLLLVWRP